MNKSKLISKNDKSKIKIKVTINYQICIKQSKNSF